MVVSSIAKAGGYTDQKGNYIKVWSNWKPVASQTVSNTDSFPVDNRLVLNNWTSMGSSGTPRSWSKTTTSFDSSWNQVWQTTQNYWWGNSSSRASSITPTAPAYSPLVQSTVQPQWAERSADWTSWYLSEEEKNKRGIVDITQQVTPWFDGSTQKFNQWQLTEDQLRARYEADLASGASQEQMQREYGDMWAPDWMGAIGSDERWAREKKAEEDRLVNKELQDINRAWQIFDRWNEDLTQRKDRWQEQNAQDVERAKEDRKFQLDEYRKNTSRNMEDTSKQRDQTMQAIRRQGAALWLNVTSTYQQSYQNTKDKFDQIINRMSEDLDTTEWRATLEDKRLDADYSKATKQLLQDFEKESTRLKQDFEYSMRDYRENMLLDANKLVERYWLSSDKLAKRIQELWVQALTNIETAYWIHQDNQSKALETLDKQTNSVLDTRNKYLTQQKTYADNFLAWSQNMTITDLNAMIRDGQISEQMAQQTLWQVVQMALDTIDTATVDGVWVQFQDQIIEAINAWMTPMQAIQQVMASEEFAPVVAKMQEMWLSSYQKALAQLQIQQGQLWLQQGQQDLQKWNLDYQTQLQDFVSTNGATGDLRGLASQFPWQAWAKNNNPAGITWNSNFDSWKWTAGLLQQAWIAYEKWTARPASEWWNYVSFPTIEDWLAAQRILMTQTYWKSTVQEMLGKWVGTGEALNYAKQVAWNAWVPLNVTVNQLNEQQLSALQMAKIQKESPWLAKLLLQGGWNQDEKDTLLSLVKKGWLTKTDQMEIADKALKQWRSKDFNEALKKWAVVDLSDGQITQYNKETDRFLGNAVVKWFEEWLTQFQWLWYALSEKSWPWDMAWVFTFMKTLDPTSVVREQEFENAAKSAWVAERRGNVYDNLTEGKILTSSQAEDFKKIAKVFIEQKAQSYDRLYANMLNSYDNFWIPQDLAPLKASDQLREYLVSTGQTPTKNVPTTAPTNNNVNRINQLRVSVPLANSPLSSKFD